MRVMNGIPSRNRNMDKFKAIQEGGVQGCAGNPPCGSFEHWEQEILASHNSLNWSKPKTIDVIVHARTVYHARRSLLRGEWTRLWTTGRLPWSLRKAQMLVVIGRELGELNMHTCACLPAGRRTLFYLAKLKRPHVEALIAEGGIHPMLTLAEARRLVAQFNGESDAKALRSNVRLRLRNFTDFVRETSVDWIAAERDFVESALREIVEELVGQVRPTEFNLRSVPHPLSLTSRLPNN